MTVEVQKEPRTDTPISLSCSQIPEFILRHIGYQGNAEFFKVLVSRGRIIPTDKRVTAATGEREMYVTKEDGVRTNYHISTWGSVLIGHNPSQESSEIVAFGFDARTSCDPDVLEYIEARIPRNRIPQPRLP